MGKRELVALLSSSSWCLVMVVVWPFLAVPWVCLRFVFVVFTDQTHYFGANNMRAWSVLYREVLILQLENRLPTSKTFNSLILLCFKMLHDYVIRKIKCPFFSCISNL